jgi:23S rRNA U2552 (ribose-2'-O)-methylase RlmE/FtsJ
MHIWLSKFENLVGAQAYILLVVHPSLVDTNKRALVSDMRRVRHWHDTDTYNYTELCDFLTFRAQAYILLVVHSSLVDTNKRVLVSDMRRVRHWHDTDTYNYIELCDFLTLLVVPVSVSCPVSVSVSML